MNNLLRDLALAHQQHEGWYPGSLSQRNNNPGNLRLTAAMKSAYGAVQGQGGFAGFPTYGIGFAALMDDIKAKICGQSRWIDYQSNPTLLDYVKVYAPSGDGNDPITYANALCSQLQAKGYEIQPSTPLKSLSNMINGITTQQPIGTPQSQIRRIQRQIELCTDPIARQLLQKQLARLQARMTSSSPS